MSAARNDHHDDEQKQLWNGAKGRAWVEAQPALDAMLQPFEDLLVEEIADDAPQSVLDVGCGAGATTLAVARSLSAPGRCVGVDISEPLIAAARSRAEREGSSARFLCADAQTHAFEPASFDAIVSRFGVMFFADPVAAFANLRRAAQDGGALGFVAWRGPEENPFMTAAERAAAPLLPSPPARRPGAPGQFAFAAEARVQGILKESGWVGIDIRPIDVACSFPEAHLVSYLDRLGPLGEALQGVDPPTRARIVETVRAAFDPYVDGSDVRFTAACWLVGARASAAQGERR
jgi:SAM-dependent methyltransferase